MGLHDNGRTGHQNDRTTRQQDYRTRGLQGNRATGQQVNRTTWQQDHHLCSFFCQLHCLILECNNHCVLLLKTNTCLYWFHENKWRGKVKSRQENARCTWSTYPLRRQKWPDERTKGWGIGALHTLQINRIRFQRATIFIWKFLESPSGNLSKQE